MSQMRGWMCRSWCLECVVFVFDHNPFPVQVTPLWGRAGWWKVSANTWVLATALSTTATSTTLCAWERADLPSTITHRPWPAMKRWRSTSEKRGGDESCWPCDCEWTWFSSLLVWIDMNEISASVSGKGKGGETWISLVSRQTAGPTKMTYCLSFCLIVWWYTCIYFSNKVDF